MTDVERIDPEAAREAMARGRALLVVADADEGAARAHLVEGAITLRELEDRRAELGRDRELIFYCDSPADRTATERAAEWRARGYRGAKVLAGGLDAWSIVPGRGPGRAGLGRRSAERPTRRAEASGPVRPPTGRRPKSVPSRSPASVQADAAGASGLPVPERGPASAASASRESSARSSAGPPAEAVDAALAEPIDVREIDGEPIDAGPAAVEVERPGGSRPGGREPRLARDVMTRNPDSIHVTASVCVAACKMREADVGALPVRDDDGRYIGMITDRDITIRVTAEGRNPDTTTVAYAMTRDFVACDEDADVREVERVMQQHRIRRIAIVKKGEVDKAHPSEIVGIISLTDLATDLQAGVQAVAPEAAATT